MKYKTSKREMYYHLTKPFKDTQGRVFNGATVFFRQEDEHNWYGTVALCSKDDQFSRKVGRNVARRRYFTIKQAETGMLDAMAFLEQPDYEAALEVAGVSGFWCDKAEDYCAPTA
jgi:hypothetical protein